MKKEFLIPGTLALMLGAIMLMSTTLPDNPTSWLVPDKYKNMKNPVDADAESLEIGKMMYKKHCAYCHGKTGLGDGTISKRLETFSGDFSGKKYQSQTDGEHFYKTMFGKDEMPGYNGKIDDEDIWHMVNYMRTFQK